MLNLELVNIDAYLREAAAKGQTGSGPLHLAWVQGSDGKPKLTTIGLFNIPSAGGANRPYKTCWAWIPEDLRADPTNAGDRAWAGRVFFGDAGDWYVWKEGVGPVKQDGPAPAWQPGMIPADVPEPTTAWVPKDEREYQTRVYGGLLSGEIRPGKSPFWPEGRAREYGYAEYLDSIKGASTSGAPVSATATLTQLLMNALAVARSLGV